CLKAQGIPDTDIKLLTPRSAGIPDVLIGTARTEAAWLGDRYAIDIDGWTNAWSNLLIRLHFGCCVLKIDSADGYRQWWYHRLVPWEHFVPVRADMSDLAEKIDWVRSNDQEAEAIARRGQALARSTTLETETAAGVDIITGYWNHSGPLPVLPAGTSPLPAAPALSAGTFAPASWMPVLPWFVSTVFL